ncbi:MULTISPECIES: type II toxin-antitoxin system RelE/ParE family toxin [Empedobacter]|uniref:type II toxin-antitoxin system RelE/ParE family toxin n=1 Tax=Empedobacter TaxID=59734 RepID=UPI00244B6FD3|nr:MULTISPECIES: type II toxin-antitoxin system RelE/ParE family toxin [Empedobacter]MDH0675005.1 type II toxin-antitoxin system RelE/ParE family toxin [Empedobacter sp. GD03861]MDM1042547.1 type II toxin-antitoxin system RelE/ParE family toxin [Empedobacter brevis]MDM1136477.1 type II toxin-antitoxin system RelE/ParE family toxin [Empedobacter sp. R750]
MAKRKIIWTKTANLERKEILEYWILRNKSKRFSIKLNYLILQTLEVLRENPTIGRRTNIDNVRVKLIREYLLLYEFTDAELIILSIWDARRNIK